MHILSWIGCWRTFLGHKDILLVLIRIVLKRLQCNTFLCKICQFSLDYLEDPSLFEAPL